MTWAVWVALIFGIFLIGMIVSWLGLVKPVRGTLQIIYVYSLLSAVASILLFLASDKYYPTYNGNDPMFIAGGYSLWLAVSFFILLEALIIFMPPKSLHSFAIVFSSKRDYKNWVFVSFMYMLFTGIIIGAVPLLGNVKSYLLLFNYAVSLPLWSVIGGFLFLHIVRWIL